MSENNEAMKIKSASSYYLVGTLFNKGIAFLTVPLFSRILSTSDYGMVTTYNSWVGILSMIMGFALHMGIRAAFINYREKIDDVMASACTFSLMAGGVMSAVTVAVCSMNQVSISMVLIILCLFQGMASAMIEDYSMYLMMKFRYKFRTALMILPNLISVIFSLIAILFVLKSDLYLGRIIPTAIVTIGFAVITILLIYSKSRCFINAAYIKFLLQISTPLIIHGIALNLLSQSDRTMITWLAGAGQTGIYSLIYNFSMLSTVITTALDGVWIPWFTEKLKLDEYSEINNRSKDYVDLITCTLIALMLVGPEAVRILADQRYWEGICIIPPLVLSNYVIFLYTLYVNVEHFYKKTIQISVNTIIAAIINIVLNFIFIPHFGYIAAAYTTLVSYFAAFVMHALFAKKLKPDLYPLKFFVKPLLQIIGAVVLFYLFINDMWIRWTVTGIYILTVIWIKRDIIFTIVFSRKKGEETE